MVARQPLRVLVLMHTDLVPPADADEQVSRATSAPADKPVDPFTWRAEYDVLRALKRLGHEPHALGVQSDLGVIRSAIDVLKPHVAFNLLEEFHGVGVYDQHVVSYLELLKVPYTGCNPRGLTLARDKVLTKKILAYHRIRTPDFAHFPIGRKVARPRRLSFPLLVKSVSEEASKGIAQASIVHNDEKLAERVAFMHGKVGTDALVEQYIEGRELYVGVLGNQRLRVLPTWEMTFSNLPEATENIATERVKWDAAYQKKLGVKTGPAASLPDGLLPRLESLCRRVYRSLSLSGCARMDLRLAPDGGMWFLEANPNPNLERGEDLALSAKAAGLSYTELLQRLLALGLEYRAAWKVAAAAES
ncbi:MAG TPA: D-alanine--D-alanine ligase [Planctomycetota bacterium]|nr:D-alanine--D-alanine ligase [Planctomycetota bacterium]